MQVIENLTRLRGHVVGRKPHPSRAGYELLSVQVDATEAVPGKADLLSHCRGTLVDVAVRSSLLPSPQERSLTAVDLRAKMSPDGPLAEPHPEAGDLRIDSVPAIT